MHLQEMVLGVYLFLASDGLASAQLSAALRAYLLGTECQTPKAQLDQRRPLN